MVRENLAYCRERIRAAALRAGRTPEEITLVAVTKGVQPELIFEAIDCGIEDIGENRIQEALLKYEELNAYARQRGRCLTWHMVGHLQTNKAKDAVRLFDLIHSVDSLRLAQELDRQAVRIGKVQDVLIEVKTSPEATKFGFLPEEVEGWVREIASLKNIRVKGLMTIAPQVDDPQKARPYFHTLTELKDKINRLTILSMGMTDDLEAAVEEGTSMVRVGRGIFGQR